jgi:lycopene beta-cyclase
VVCDSEQFDDGVATLMDFAGCLDDGVLFHYVLPVARNRALIETTVFGPRPLSAASLASHQHAAVEKFCGGVSRTIVRSEHGILPMGLTTIAPPPGEGYVRAGVMHGGARPSTGYAFQRIQRWADDTTSAIRRGAPVTGHTADPRMRRWMDLLFLRVVRHHPDRAADLFLSIFGVTDPARIIRFLTDTGSLADHSAVIAALPTGQFLRELWDGMWASPGNQLELV